MKTVKLLVSHLIGSVNEPAGKVLEVSGERAAAMLRCGAAEATDLPDTPDPGPEPDGEAPDPDPDAGLQFDAMTGAPARAGRKSNRR